MLVTYSTLKSTPFRVKRGPTLSINNLKATAIAQSQTSKRCIQSLSTSELPCLHTTLHSKVQLRHAPLDVFRPLPWCEGLCKRGLQERYETETLSATNSMESSDSRRKRVTSPKKASGQQTGAQIGLASSALTGHNKKQFCNLAYIFMCVAHWQVLM